MLFSSLTARLARRPVTASLLTALLAPSSWKFKLTTTWLMLLTPQLCSCHFPAKKTSLGFPLLSIKWCTPSSSQNEGFFSKWAFVMGLHGTPFICSVSGMMRIIFVFQPLGLSWSFNLSLAASTLSPSSPSVASPTCRAYLRCLPTSLRPYHTWG